MNTNIKIKICCGMIAALEVCACSWRSSEQKHYLLYTRTPQKVVDVIVRDTASTLNLNVSMANFTMQGGAISHNIELYGHGYSIFIQSAADQQCYSPNSNRLTTFENGLYDVNIVKTSFLASRFRIKAVADVLSERAIQHGAMMSDREFPCAPTKKTVGGA